ncbi:DUF167 family protein [Chitinimonas lacunae]|uniref:UPF0235 protein ACFOW7_19200 n=1 Tax=Chitinimonas lacunae TaxID=1963018 RepID=A0ABV8MWG1_9NEIS
MSWWQQEGEVLTLMLYIQPGARKTEPAGLFDGMLKLRLAAPPVEGKANAALLAWLAGQFQVGRNRVSLLSGETSRRKRVRIEGSAVDPASLLS